MYLFISFVDHLEEKSRNYDDFFNEPLINQYKRLSMRVSANERIYSFSDFIHKMMPNLTGTFFVSCPNFIREKDENRTGTTQFLRNVVIRPRIRVTSRKYLPDNQELILIGDVVERNSLNSFEVKGIEFIDSSMADDNELSFTAIPNFAFSLVTNQYGKTYPEYEIDKVRDQSVLTPDVIPKIIQHSYVISDHYKVRDYYEKWWKYLHFRYYYLDKQTQEYLKIDGAELLRLYAVTKKEYNRNSNYYEPHLFSGIPATSDMVVLEDKVGDAEPLNLIYVHIDKNILDYNAHKIVQRKRETNETTLRLYSISRDNAFVSPINPFEDGKGSDGLSYRKAKGQGYLLGDRFYLPKQDEEIEPTAALMEIKRKYEDQKDRARRAVERKYEAIIDNEVKKCVADKKQELQRELEGKLQEFAQSQKARRASELKNPSVQGIVKAYNAAKKAARSGIKKEKKEKDADYQERLSEVDTTVDLAAIVDTFFKEELEQKKRGLESEKAQKLLVFERQKKKDLQTSYRLEIDKEIAESETNLQKEYLEEVEHCKKTKTTIRIGAFFHINEATSDAELNEAFKEKISGCVYLAYDDTAEKAQLDRKQKALDNFFKGYVKNPYLAHYLFESDNLAPLPPFREEEWAWYPDNLNEKQKEAVQKAVRSNGIFLLQGPPGTGKTQVIAEVVAHLVKQGKKVLVSSETPQGYRQCFRPPSENSRHHSASFDSFDQC